MRKTIHVLLRAALPVLACPITGLTGGCIVVHDSPPAAVYEPAPPPAPVVVQEEVYQPAPEPVVVEYRRELSPYGRWVRTRYGDCWMPYDRPRDWQPYTVGHFEDTDRGWCWASEGPESDWGVITYHYGRWYEEPAYGWVWLPGAVWAPAWVSWREGGGYCGWYPLPPQCGEGVNVSVVEVDRYCPRDRYVYCDERYINEPSVYRHVERQNVTIINRTTNITNITYVNNRVENRGVAVRNVEERSGRRVNRAELAETDNVGQARQFREQGKPVVYAPAVVARAAEESRPRLKQAMSSPPYRQTGNHQVPANHPYAPTENRSVPDYSSRQAQEQQKEQSRQQEADVAAQARQREMEQKSQASQRRQEKLDVERQQAAAKAAEQEQKRAEAESQRQAHQQQMQQHEAAVKQQEQEARQQQEAARQQRMAEREQAAQAQRDRAAAEAEARNAARQERQKNPPGQGGKQSQKDKAAQDAQQQNPGPPPAR